MRGWGIWIISMAVGCAAQSASPGANPTCPPCECTCDCQEGASISTTPASASAASNDVSALVRSATAKARKRDGAGCLQDLDRMAKADPAMDRTLLHLRGQCLMLSGRCEQGQRLARQGLKESMGIEVDAERLDDMVESYAAMYCTGKVDDRMAVLRALSNLQNAAYMAAKSADFCRQQENTVRRLGARIKPKGRQDHRVRNLDQQLFALAPACYARAGDCTAAYAAFKRLLPAHSASAFSRMPLAERDKSQREMFEAMVDRCAPG